MNHPFANAVLADDHDAALATIADDVVFRSPAVHKPYHGKEQVAGILRLVATVFENFRYTAEWRDGATTILFFEANVGDRELQGIDILEENERRARRAVHGDDPAAVRAAGGRGRDGGEARQLPDATASMPAASPNTATRLRPRCFAVYIAASALRTRSSWPRRGRASSRRRSSRRR